MAITSELRRSDRFIGNGSQAAFPFNFKVFSSDQVKVVIADTDGAETVLDASAFSVSLSTDQDNTPGGTVTLKSPLARNYILVILSKVPQLQPTVFTNRGGFFPSALNDSLDRLTILTQQIYEIVERCLVVPSTSEKTPQQVLQEILDIAATANIYAIEARNIYDKAVVLDANVTANANSVSLMKSSVDASERNVANLAAQVNEYSDELMMVAENLDAIRSVDNNEEVFATLAADLEGYPIYEFDGGEIDEPNVSANGVGGVMKVCADNIELIKPGEKYYGELIGGWASKTPDTDFILGMLTHPHEAIYRLCEKAHILIKEEKVREEENANIAPAREVV